MARALRVLRAECNNPSQEEVSRLGNCSKSSISPALNAECLPTETVVRAIVSGCLRFAERSDDEVRRAEERLCALWHDLKVQEGGRKARPASADVDVATPLPPARQTRQRRPRLVVATAAVALVAALLGSHLYLDEVRDRLRGGDDFSVATEIVQLGDEGFTTATREPYSLSQEQRRRMREPGALADPGPFIETVRADGGAAAGDLTIRLTLRGRRHQSLRITNIRFDVIDREAPHNGTLFHIPPQGSRQRSR